MGNKTRAWCSYWDKALKEVYEYEQCWKNGWDCRKCPYFGEKGGCKTMLIQKDNQGNWNLKGVPWDRLHPGNALDDEMWKRLYGALWRLMEYEDIGLDPGQVRELAEKDIRGFAWRKI